MGSAVGEDEYSAVGRAVTVGSELVLKIGTQL